MEVLPIQTIPEPQSESPLGGLAAGKRNFVGFDAVRPFAAIGVVLLHSGVPYLTHRMPGLVWPVRDTPSRWVDLFFWSIELFIMPLFLVMAGFLAWQTLGRRGPLELVKNRARRLLWPLAFGAVCILPLSLYTWILGWVVEGTVAPIKLQSLKFDAAIEQDLWGLSHLWFLHYLFFYVVVLAVVAHLQARYLIFRRFKMPSWCNDGKALVALLIMAGSVVLLARPQVIWGFQHAFAPVPSKWVYNGLFFAVGCLVAIRDPDWKQIQSYAPRLAIPIVVLALTTVVLGQWHLAEGNSSERPLAHLGLAVMTSTSSMGISLGIIGLCICWIERIPVSVQYLAAASFWIYLVHHPLIGLIHIDLKWMLPGVSPVLKATVACVGSLAASLLTYEGLVRRSALGRSLGFAWEFPRKARHEDSHDTDFVAETNQVLPIGPTSESEDEIRRAA